MVRIIVFFMLYCHGNNTETQVPGVTNQNSYYIYC